MPKNVRLHVSALLFLSTFLLVHAFAWNALASTARTLPENRRRQLHGFTERHTPCTWNEFSAAGSAFAAATLAPLFSNLAEEAWRRDRAYLESKGPSPASPAVSAGTAHGHVQSVAKDSHMSRP